MIFELINKAITGDAVFTAGGLLAACFALILTNFAHWPAWVKGLYFAALALGLAILGHLLIEQMQLFWVTPLGEPLKIIKH